jgi:hypothetical protein
MGVAAALQDPLVYGAGQRLGEGVHFDGDFIPRFNGGGVVHQDLRKFFEALIGHVFTLYEVGFIREYREFSPQKNSRKLAEFGDKKILV